MSNSNWSSNEVILIVADYFSMLIDELLGNRVDKAIHNKSLLPLLNDRTAGSISYKYQNISAVLIEMGLPFIHGYKPLYNYQKMLIAEVERFVRQNIDLEQIFLRFSDINMVVKPVELDKWLVSPPNRGKDIAKISFSRNPIKINYLKREQENHLLGLSGEELVFQYEKRCLVAAGLDHLSDGVKWSSKDRGDGLGYDILSKNINGTDKFIEVKTTKLSKETPFYFSDNEFQFSIENEHNYYLYRIFDFNNITKLFILNGRFDNFCQLQPMSFKGSFNFI